MMNSSHLNRKEYFQFKFKEINNDIDLNSNKERNEVGNNSYAVIDKELEKYGKLVLNGYQNFITNFMSYNEKNDRLLLMHSTGVGKTISSLSSAINQMNTIGGNIFILGFSKSVFRKELLNRPEFGYVSKEEVDYMKIIKDNILKYKKQDDKDKLKELKRKIVMRLSRGKENKIYFIGYKMLSSKLFIKLSKNADLDSIKSIEDIEFMISKKWIKLNKDFINQINESFIICDEIHNLYNSNYMNSWGTSLKYALDNIKAKTLFLSATPVNNRPEKIVSVINLLSKKTFTKSDIFKNNSITEMGKNIIKNEINGKVSFLMDRDIKNYPASVFKGNDIEGVLYLKFIECKASQLQEKTISYIYKESTENIEELIESLNKEDEDIKHIYEDSKRIPLEGKYRILNDMVYPNVHDKFGIFLKEDMLNLYSNMNVETSKVLGVVYKNRDRNNIECGGDVDGDYLSKENIGDYSGKYLKLLNLLEDIFSKGKGKTFIYHNYVQGSGTCTIKNLLKRNGIIEHGETSSSKTRCSKCYRYKSDHGAECEFKPLAFIYATGYVSKSELEYKLDLFNSNSNKEGENIGIIVGSQAIKESYDFKAVRNVIVAYMPDNISTLIQVLGRAVRKNSHISLDKEKRNVDIYILITTLQNEKSFEINKYAYKTKMFQEIKKINKLLMENSIDFDNNYDINFQNNNSDKENIYSLPVVERKYQEPNISKNNFTSFDAYYLQEEVKICQFIIKRIILESYPIPVSFDFIKQKIINASKDNTIGSRWINRDTSFINTNSIISALFYLTNHNNKTYLSESNSGNYVFAESLFSGKYIIINENKHILKEDSGMFFATPIDTHKIQSLYDFYRLDNQQNNIINVNNIVNSKNSIFIQRDSFIEECEDTPIELMDRYIQSIEPAVHKHTVEFVIEYIHSMWLHPKRWKMSEFHSSIVKLLFFYNKFNIIIFANYIDTNLENEYKNYYNKGIIKKSKLNLTTSTDSHYKNYKNLQNTINASEDELNNIMNGYSLKYHKYYKYKDKMIISKSTESVKDFMLPIGHYFDTKIKIISSEGVWSETSNFNKLTEFVRFKDNKYIIGFLEKDKSGFRISFKIRINTNNSGASEDSRKIIVGSVCEHYDKEQLISICHKLGIKLNTKEDKKKYSMCDKIKIKLIQMELDARKNDSNIRYFKFFWE